MKNASIVSILILAAAYSAAVAASTFGIVSVRLPDFSSAVGAYVALGVLAFAFRDYARQSRTEARPSFTRSPRAGVRPAAHPLALTNPTLYAN